MSSVYGEIIRNKDKRGYTAEEVQELCDIRKERYKGNRKFTHAMERHIRDRLTDKQRSPQQIFGEPALNDVPMVAHERIHQFIPQDKTLGGELWKHTRHRFKHRKRPVGGKQVNINKVSIELRPPIVDARERCGD